jgi:hypothetical protein
MSFFQPYPCGATLCQALKSLHGNANAKLAALRWHANDFKAVAAREAGLAAKAQKVSC